MSPTIDPTYWHNRAQAAPGEFAPLRYLAGCYECDTRPMCPVCGRPVQEGSPSARCLGVGGPEPYRRGLVWHFGSEAQLAAWEAAHAPLSVSSLPDSQRHSNYWSLRTP